MRFLRAAQHACAWYQGLVLVLVAVVGLQGMPIEALVDAPTPCIYTERGFCPLEAEGSCGCDHHNHGEHDTRTASDPVVPAFDGPVLKSCNTDVPDGVGPLSPVKWLASTVPSRDLFASLFDPVALPPILISQRVVDDIFHPPWLWTV